MGFSTQATSKNHLKPQNIKKYWNLATYVSFGGNLPPKWLKMYMFTSPWTARPLHYSLWGFRTPWQLPKPVKPRIYFSKLLMPTLIITTLLRRWYGARHLVTTTFVQKILTVQISPLSLFLLQKWCIWLKEENCQTVLQNTQNWGSYKCVWTQFGQLM